MLASLSLSEIHTWILEATIVVAMLIFCIALLIMKWRYLWHLVFGSKGKKRKGKRKRKQKRVTNNVQINVAIIPHPRDRDDLKLPSPEEQFRLDETRHRKSLHE